MLSIRREKYLFDVYNSVSELYNDLKNKKARPEAYGSSDDGDFYFTQTHNLQEAYDLMLHGDNDMYSRIKNDIKKIDITKILGNAIKKNNAFNDLVGYQANVSNYLKGIPTDMINTKPTKRSQKIINIVVNNTVSARMTTDEIIKASSYYYVIIDLLEKIGYRCNVYIMSNYHTSEDDGYLLVRAKVDREPFNKYKMAFLLVHPSFLRRISFKWTECCNCKGEPTHNGYGKPITDNEQIKSIVDKELNANFIVWSLQKDYELKIEDIIKRLKESGIEIGDVNNEK